MVKKKARSGGGRRISAVPLRSGKASKKSREKKDFKTHKAYLFIERKRSYGIYGTVPPRQDMSRVIKWPRYIRLQRQRAILKKRLKVPPSIAQFSHTLDKNQVSILFKLMAKYRPETRKEKKHRLYEIAQHETEEKEKDASQKPRMLKFGLKHITYLVEQKKAKLIVIAHDVDPIELVVWLPALCKKMYVPYCIVKGKARLGAFVHQKTATCIAFTDVKKGDEATLNNIVATVRPSYNDKTHISWGGGKMGMKAEHRKEKLARIKEKEASQKLE